MSPPAGDGHGKLSWDERRFLGILGMPMLATTLAVTIVASFVPVLIQEISGPALTGLLIGAEGLFAIVVPPAVGAWSDRFRTPIGRRLPFVFAATPLTATTLVLLPLSKGTLPLVAGLLVVFFAAYYVYSAPYWALYPDLVQSRMRGRSVGSMGFWRAIGIFTAVVGGGLMLAAWQPLPFVVAAVALVVITGAFARTVVQAQRGTGVTGGAGDDAGGLLDGLRRIAGGDPRVRSVLAANMLWETGLGALRAFVILFFTVGLGYSLELTSAALATVAGTALVAAPLAGTLADRIGELRLLRTALWVYGLGLLLPFFTQSPLVLIVVPPLAFAGVAVMTLPLAVLMSVLPERDHGTATGLFGLSRGLGLLLGPLAAGTAISLMEPLLEGTDGYAAMFLVASVAVLASIPLIGRIDRQGAGG